VGGTAFVSRVIVPLVGLRGGGHLLAAEDLERRAGVALVERHRPALLQAAQPSKETLPVVARAQPQHLMRRLAAHFDRQVHLAGRGRNVMSATALMPMSISRSTRARRPAASASAVMIADRSSDASSNRATAAF